MIYGKSQDICGLPEIAAMIRRKEVPMRKKISYLFIFFVLISMIGCGGAANRSSESSYKVAVLSKNQVNAQKDPVLFATQNEESYTGTLEEIDEIENIYLSINDVIVELKYQFIHPEKALDAISQSCENILSEIQRVYSLEPLSENNWSTYKKTMWDYLDKEEKPQWYSSQNEEFGRLADFFDIYENAYNNNQVIDIARNADSVGELLTETDFVSVLPFFKEQFCEKLAETVNKTAEDFNLTF